MDGESRQDDSIATTVPETSLSTDSAVTPDVIEATSTDNAGAGSQPTVANSQPTDADSQPQPTSCNLVSDRPAPDEPKVESPLMTESNCEPVKLRFSMTDFCKLLI